MFSLQIPGWQIVVRTVVVYLAVYVGLRLMGKRELGRMTVFDLVVILLIANAVQNAMVGPDVSVAGGVPAAFVLLAVNRGVAALRPRREFWGRLLEGTPTVLKLRCPAPAISIVPKSYPVVRTRKHIRQFRKH